MKNFKTAWDKLVYWKLAVVKCLGKSIITIVMSLAQALNGLNWGDFTSTQKFICIALAVAQGYTIIDAFLDKTMSELSDEDSIQKAVQTNANTVAAAISNP